VHVLTAKAADAAGNVSSASSGLAITVDASAPTASVTTASITSGSTVTTAQSSEPGRAYLVSTSATVTDLASLDALVTANSATQATVSVANTDTTLSTTALDPKPRLEVTVARREGIVSVVASDNHPQRAAGLANQAVEELKQLLRGLSLDEAQQRRTFYEEQLTQARQTLEAAQQRLRASGFDSAALRTEPGAAAAGYARQQAEITAAEIRLAALRRVRADSSTEVLLARAEIDAMRSKLARLEAPGAEGGGEFSGRLRQLRYAEQLVDTLTRQLDAARVDAEAAQVPVQWLDRAQPDHVPASPNPVLWGMAGAVLGVVLQAAWVLIRHSAAMARTDERRQKRLQQIAAVLPARSRGFLMPALKLAAGRVARWLAQMSRSKRTG
jgi:uncharacterized protein involved in exopolysaccharide biosynthesis